MRKIQCFIIICVLSVGLFMAAGPLAPEAAQGDLWKESIEAPAPDFILKDLEGEEVRLSDYRGKTVLLYFMTTWCIKCRQTIPYLKEIHSKYKDKDVAVFAIDINEPPSRIRAYVEKHQLPYRVLLDTGKVALSYNVIGVPTFILLDADGIIKCRQCRSLDMFLEKSS